jgi:hypothetical protein
LSQYISFLSFFQLVDPELTRFGELDHISHQLPLDPVDELFRDKDSFEEPFLPADLFRGHFVGSHFGSGHSLLHFLDLLAHDAYLPFIGLGFDVPNPSYLLELDDSLFNLIFPFLFLLEFALQLTDLVL